MESATQTLAAATAALSFIDIVIIVVGLGGLVIGWRRGITRILGDVAAIAAGLLAARAIYSQTQALHTALATFVATYAVTRVFAGRLHSVVKRLMLGPFNALLGAIFVAAEYVLFLSIILNAWCWARGLGSDSPPEAPFAGDRLAEAVTDLWPRVMGAVTKAAGVHSIPDPATIIKSKLL